MRFYLPAMVVLFATAPLRSQEGTTIRVPVRLVSVPALVFSRHGRIVSGLEARDFTVLDNGLKQKVELETEVSPPSIAIAIESGSSVSEYVSFVERRERCWIVRW